MLRNQGQDIPNIPYSPTLEDTALFMMSRASLNLSLTEGCASTWSENMDFQPRYHLVISS